MRLESNKVTLSTFSRLSGGGLISRAEVNTYKFYASKFIKNALVYLSKNSKNYLFLSQKNIFVALHFVLDKEIEKINHTYRDKKQPTNVISLAYFSSEELRGESLPFNLDLGEIFISFETLVREAREQFISVEDYFHKLLVHGLLHLLGFDHSVEESATLMYNMEERLLRESNITTTSIVNNYWNNI